MLKNIFKLPYRNYILNKIRNIDDNLYDISKTTKILFIYTDTYGFSCQVPIIQALETKSNVYIRVTTEKNIPLGKIQCSTELEQNIFNKYYIHQKRATFSKWHLILDTHLNSFYPKRNALRIGMHHGPGFGILGSKIHLVQNYDIFLGLSQIERYFLEQIKPDVFTGNRAFFAAGFPKVDSLINQTLTKSKIYVRFKLKDKPTIIITSHWQPTSTLGTFGSEVFELIASNLPDYNVIQTGHPWLWKGHKQIPDFDSHELIQKLNIVADKYQNAFFLPNENAKDLLQIADLLIADHSSIITTYCLLDKPIVWFDNPEVNFAIPEIREAYKNASCTFSDIENLPEICLHALVNPDEKKRGRKIMRDIFYTTPGKSAKHIAKLLMAIGPTCSTDSPNWPNIVKLSQQEEHLPKPIENFFSE